MNEDASASAATARASHLDWLQSERAAFEAHEKRASQAPGASDFAVGSDAYVNLEDEEPVYRSLSLVGPHEASAVYEEEPVYRGINFGRLAVAEPPLPLASSPATTSAPDAHATWAAQKRPPLLRRQNAFVCRDADADLLGGLGQDA
mmetsp:Transcript_13601/g.34941  ORF Transcript_13601/g.34941 Transcript_13601/m.34941 type:complete len:147 (+) Transcript_13601:114-554(+)